MPNQIGCFIEHVAIANSRHYYITTILALAYDSLQYKIVVLYNTNVVYFTKSFVGNGSNNTMPLLLEYAQSIPNKVVHVENFSCTYRNLNPATQNIVLEKFCY